MIVTFLESNAVGLVVFLVWLVGVAVDIFLCPLVVFSLVGFALHAIASHVLDLPGISTGSEEKLEF